MTIDLTGVAVAAVSGIFSILGLVLTFLINKYVQDKAAKETLATALQNSLGAGEQAATSAVSVAHPSIEVVGMDKRTAASVQYVLNHAGPEAARFGLTPDSIADKVNARIGLRKLDAATAATVNTTVATTVAATVAAANTATSPTPVSARLGLTGATPVVAPITTIQGRTP